MQVTLYDNKHQNVQGIMNLPNGQNKILDTDHIATDMCKLSEGELKGLISRKLNIQKEHQQFKTLTEKVKEMEIIQKILALKTFKRHH